jgi:CRP-like cAMP-binding protein
MSPSPSENQLSRRITFLRNVPPFVELGYNDLATLVEDFRLRRYDEGTVIFHQGDHSRDLYIVLEGKVRIFLISPSGDETSIQVFSTHDVIGEFSTIDARPRSATAKAIMGCELLVITHQRFLQRMREMPDLAIGVAKLLTSKARWTAAYAEALAQFDAAGRLLHILLLYNEQFGQALLEGERYLLDLSLNQSELASLVGARREWINRILKDWGERGLVEYDDGRIIILDLPRVRRERDNRIGAIHDAIEW